MAKIVSALLCDEVRQESNGKFIAIGIYRGAVQFLKLPAKKGFTVLAQARELEKAGEYSISFKVLVGGKKIQENAGILSNTVPSMEWLPIPIDPIEFTEETDLKIYAKIDEQRWRSIFEIPIRVKPSDPNPTA